MTCEYPKCFDGENTCSRHKCVKTPRQIELCQEGGKYWDAWESCKMPDQDCHPQAKKKVGIIQKARNAYRAASKWIQHRRPVVPKSEQDRRLAICAECEHWKDSKCVLCGCFTKLKTKMGTEGCPVGRWEPFEFSMSNPLVTTPLEDPTRHLLFYLYPVKSNDIWKMHLDRIAANSHIFTGRKILGVSIGDETVSLNEVKDRHPDLWDEVYSAKNDPDWREVTTWPVQLQSVLQGCGENEITLYAQGKGVSDHTNIVGHDMNAIQLWTDVMYQACLGYMPLVESQLASHGITGCMKHNGIWSTTNFYYSGTFFWFRNASVAVRPHTELKEGKYSVEAWPGTVFTDEEGAVLFRDFGNFPKVAEKLYSTKGWVDLLDEWQEWQFHHMDDRLEHESKYEYVPWPTLHSLTGSAQSSTTGT